MSQLSLDSQRQKIGEIRSSLNESLSTIENMHLTLDSVVPSGAVAPESYGAFITRGTYTGSYEAYGGAISDADRSFYSTREPFTKWLVYWIAQDIWDNWFKVIDPENPRDEALDKAVQKVLRQLKAKRELKRLTVFERRYGWAVLLCGYSGFDDNTWMTPIYNEEGNFLENVSKLLQITSYPKTKVSITKENENSASLRFGLPDIYTITRGGTKSTHNQVHWSRLIHDAPRLDEHLYEGVSVIDGIFDVAVAFRNALWGEAQTIFRHGSGFPVITIPGATRAQINQMITDGEFANIHARTYFVLGGDAEARETLEFKGAQTAALDPDPYNTLFFACMAIGTRIPQDILKGVSAGRITGSEVNERSYYKLIQAEQDPKEDVLRELINRLIDTGQISYEDRRRGTPTKDYIIEWNYPSLITERDRANIEYLEARTNAEKLDWMTIDEVRELTGRPPLPDDDGTTVLGLKRLERPAGGSPFTPNPERPPEEGVTEDEDSDEERDEILEDALKRGKQR